MAYPLCGEFGEIHDHLGNKWHEVPFAVGMITPTVVAEFYVSKDRGFTVLQVEANGRTCVVVSGVGLILFEPEWPEIRPPKWPSNGPP